MGVMYGKRLIRRMIFPGKRCDSSDMVVGLREQNICSQVFSPKVSIDAAGRNVTTSNFSVTWNTGVDTEAITSPTWMGGSNSTTPYEVNTCDSGGDEYFGNSWAPPDPQSGGLVLVGGGTITGFLIPEAPVSIGSECSGFSISPGQHSCMTFARTLPA